MFNWFDLMRQAQTNAALATLAQQFNLSGDQAQKTMAAFMPAFAMGLQHATASNDPARLVQSMMSGAFQNFWQAAGNSFSPQAQQEGRRLLDQLFGSDEVSRRVAHQAADYAGISTDTMQQLFPILAGVMAGGMSHWMTAHAQALQSFASAKDPTKEKPGGANPWADLWAGWMTATAPEKKHANPFEDMMASVLKAPGPEAPKEEPPAASASFDDMMEKGREMQLQYLASLQSIFSDAWQSQDRKA
ncbi:DUF937 domain-containing protein [Microvirga terrae]|uniref:DUF937 domain-containing protein n=1 Tax=Microvirga terrae TaxID=2740529 RepID=A0ABY5RN21_9HYPH|nr:MULTISPECIES: DUF937 domain-containing protein [Microvirga]MBQ0822805.1 DUF937 domain-containing protein [Microvirga sp. HBU67558]UVF18635.1 DUF937 domain-containing protein [Microvirga terrae]